MRGARGSAARGRRPVATCLAVAAALVVAGSAWPARADTPTPAIRALAAYTRMTPAQRIGQLFMVGVPVTGTTSSTRAVLTQYRVGSTILMGTSSAGTSAVAAVVGPVRTATTEAGVLPFVAVDQEGGYVQHLKGTGFSTIPTALRQGTLSTTTLRTDWRTWGTQLRRAGVNLDLAPVADVVPASIGTANQPIGRYYREYGYTTSVVSPHVAAVVAGMHDVGLGSSAKHFPGLGRASGNTDSKAGVTDPTRRHDGYLAPFQAAVTAGVPVVMVSTAIYPNIDPGTVAVFSRLVTTTMLRQDLGFRGLVVTDSLQAASLGAYSYATRAVRSLQAGVQLLLLTSTAPLAAMTSAIQSRVATDPAFASLVRSAVLGVLVAKATAGLLVG